MKRVIFLSFVLLQSIIVAFASEPQFLLSLSGVNMARVGFINNIDESTVLLLTNEKGKAVYEEKIESGKHFFKFLNLSSLPDGNYYFRLKEADEPLPKALIIKNSQAQIVNLGTEKPDVTLDNNQVMINYYNQSQDVIKVMVIQDNDILFEKYFEQTLVHHKLNMADFPSGNCSVLVKSDIETYKYPLCQY
ncbi:MAG: hypothetical protein GVY19_12430 [Bacteroidetes bacterium]|jgi:hypothetical protein|nr:hypothetical protein [Bacteroidota bacterium]